MGILDYFTLPESHKTKNLLSKFPKGIPNFREGNPQNHAYGIITVYIHNDYSIGMCYDISKKSWRIGIFSPFFLCCFYFLLKVHVNFSLVFYRNYRAVVTSSRHRPFFFHNFVFLLNCLFVLYNAHRISVCIIAVSKSHELMLKVRQLSSFFRRRRIRLHVDAS